MPIQIKQASTYINYAMHLYPMPSSYDYRLTVCDYDGCTRLCEKDMGTCDVCIEKITDAMSHDLDEVLNGK